jgi:hypothetical protein
MAEKQHRKFDRTRKWGLQKFMVVTSMHSMLMITIVIVFIVSMGMWYLVQNYLTKVNRELYGIQSNSADQYISRI